MARREWLNIPLMNERHPIIIGVIVDLLRLIGRGEEEEEDDGNKAVFQNDWWGG